MAQTSITGPLVAGGNSQRSLQRSNSISQASENSQTAQEFIESQLQLEADAREALPYQFDECTRPLGPLRQILFSCLTCNPAPSSPSEPYDAAGICYSCSISCHGEHNLVELFNKRNFVCDCGTTRLPSSTPCTLRLNQETGSKGNVHSEKPADANRYNQNFRNRFCGCGEDYDAGKERGTMFQCIGLGTVEDGGCGEDWWHPECIVGLPRDWYRKAIAKNTGGKEEEINNNGEAKITSETANAAADTEISKDDPVPPGFPNEDDFESFICYKCVESFPWIKRYAGTKGFLMPVYRNDGSKVASTSTKEQELTSATSGAGNSNAPQESDSKKRKASPNDVNDVETSDQPIKRQRNSISPEAKSDTTATNPNCRYATLAPPSGGHFSLCLEEDFRDHFCRCRDCFPSISKQPYLLEEEDTYEPPLSSTAGDDDAPGSLGSRSLLDRGEAALSNVDRVRAIEGVMVYNHLKDKVKDFLKPFAESGTPVGAEDIKRYFEGLRGDADAIRAAAANSNASGGGGGGDDDADGEANNRKEQSGY